MSRSTKILLAGALLILASLPWLRLNLTASAPRGLWLLHPVPAVVERGMWVILPVPAAVQVWGPPWAPLLKPVAAVAGEQVCVKDATLWIQDVSYGRVYAEAHGQPLPHMEEGCLTVEAGRVFLASQAARSLDSRYFRTVPVTAVRAQARLLFTLTRSP